VQAAKALLAAQAEGCTEDVICALAMLTAETVFFTPRDKEREARAARARFMSPDGDHATLLRVLAGYRGTAPKRRGAWCRDHFINMRALSRAADVADQLRRGVTLAGMPLQAVAAASGGDGATFGEDTAPLRRALTAGFFLQARARAVMRMRLACADACAAGCSSPAGWHLQDAGRQPNGAPAPVERHVWSLARARLHPVQRAGAHQQAVRT
jgi:HrpA-like RNA helicase